MYRKIIIGHDLHSGGDDALALGREIAQAMGAQLVIAGVYPTGALPLSVSGADAGRSVPGARPPARSRERPRGRSDD